MSQHSKYRQWRPVTRPTTIRLNLNLSNIWIHIQLLMIYYEHQKLFGMGLGS